jgi:hypothetical protein
MVFINKLKNLVENEKNKYTIDELLEHFGTGSIVVALILVTFITSIPLPPWGGGFETIPGGILSIILALQGFLGFEKLYLPKFLKQFEVDIKMLKDSHYTEKTLNFIDKHIEPNRYAWVFNGITQKLMFALVIPNALLMLVPIVFTNGPPSQCITLMAMTWLLSDGYYYLLMLGISLFVFVAYIILFFVFAKLLYRTRRTWTFGLWR